MESSTKNLASDSDSSNKGLNKKKSSTGKKSLGRVCQEYYEASL